MENCNGPIDGSAKQNSHATDSQTLSPSEYLRATSVLNLLPISRRTLERWKSQGRIPFIRAGSRLILYRRSDIEKMLTRFTVGRAS